MAEKTRLVAGTAVILARTTGSAESLEELSCACGHYVRPLDSTSAIQATLANPPSAIPLKLA